MTLMNASFAGTPDVVPEDQLLPRLRTGDPSAFAVLATRDGQPLLAFSRRLLKNDHDAQDAVQDAFLSAFKALPKFDGRAQLGTWLHRIAVNAALMRLRKHRNEPITEELSPGFLPDGHR